MNGMSFKSKDKIVLWMLSVLFVLTIFAGIIIQEFDCINSVRFVFTQKNDSYEKIELFKQDEKYYLFLPSHCELQKLNVEYLFGCSMYIEGKYYDTETTCGELEINKEYSFKMKNSIGVVVADEILVILKAKNVPTFSITLDDSTLNDLNSDKEIKRNGTCDIVTSDGEIDFSGQLSVKGRGGSTWRRDKKPYNISLNKSVGLLNMNSSNEWCLLSNPIDTSNMRNKIVYDSSALLGMRYSVQSEYVNLYINCQYIGLYLLTERIGVGEQKVDISDLDVETQAINSAKLNTYDSITVENDGRFYKYYNIPNSPEDITGGYIIELQFYDERNIHESVYTTTKNTCFMIESLPYASKEQVMYISDLTESLEQSLYNGSYEKYIDVESWVRYYLIQEVFGNIDNRSLIYYKDSDFIDGKIYAGPVWDFDVSLENSFFDQEINPEAFYANTWGWNQVLYKDEKFYDLVVDEYKKQFRDFLDDLIDYKLNDYAKKIEASYIMNRVRWKDSSSFIRSDNFETAQEQILHIKEYLRIRKKFLDDVWLGGREVCSIKATSSYPNPLFFFYSTDSKTSFAELPELEYENYRFLGWYDANTNEKYIPGQVITENMVYVAKWEAIDEKEEYVVVSTWDKIKRIIVNNFYLLIALFLFSLIGVVIIIRVFVDLRSRKKELRHTNE